jgi:hypothetical protein
MALPKAGGTFRKWRLWKEVRLLEACPRRRFLEVLLFLLFASWPPLDEPLCSTCHSHHDILPHHRPKTIHGLKSLKLSVKINLASL